MFYSNYSSQKEKGKAKIRSAKINNDLIESSHFQSKEKSADKDHPAFDLIN